MKKAGAWRRKTIAMRHISAQLKEQQDSRSYKVFSTHTDGLLHDAARASGAGASPDLHELGLEGLQLGDIFNMGAVIGTGASGVVAEASLKSCPSRRVAIKSISKVGSWWLNSRARREETTLREIVLLQELTLQHVTGTVQVIAAIETASHVHIVTELCTGGDLLAAIHRNKGPIPEPLVAHTIRSLATTLAEIHNRGVVHRDIKLENVVYVSDTDATAGVKLIDFGLSNTLGGHNNHMLHSCVGTNLFMAPEVMTKNRATKRRDYGTKSDMWGVGVIVYAMLCDKLPFSSNGVHDLEEEVSHGVRFNPKRWRDISPEAKELARQLLCSDPSKRISASELLKNEWLQTQAEAYEVLSEQREQSAEQALAAEVPAEALKGQASSRAKMRFFELFCLPGATANKQMPAAEQQPDQPQCGDAAAVRREANLADARAFLAAELNTACDPSRPCAHPPRSWRDSQRRSATPARSKAVAQGLKLRPAASPARGDEGIDPTAQLKSMATKHPGSPDRNDSEPVSAVSSCGTDPMDGWDSPRRPNGVNISEDSTAASEDSGCLAAEEVEEDMRPSPPAATMAR